MKQEILSYRNIRLLDIYADEPENWNEKGVTNVRVVMPANPNFGTVMAQKGYMFADRLLNVSVNLRHSKIDYNKMVRLDVRETDQYKKDILHIAQQSFPYDRRFHVFYKLNDDIAPIIIEDWIYKLDKVLVCMYKENVTGFLALKEINSDSIFVYLAAVEEKYRIMGAAMSLYAKAVIDAGKKGYAKLEGRISSRNIAVINLYNFLGASVIGAYDMYIKEVIA